MLLNLGFLIPALLCWCGAVYCLSFLRTHPGPAVTALLVSFVARGAAFLLGAPRVYGLVDRVAGETNTARLLINVCGIVWSLAMCATLLYWRHGQHRARRILRRWTIVAAVAITVSAVLWVRSNVPGTALPETALGFSEAGAHQWSIASLMAIYHLSMASAVCALAISAVRYRAWTSSRVVRLGLTCTATGSLLYLVFSVNRIVVIVSSLTDGPGLVIPFASPALTGIGATAMMLGLTAPMWSRHLAPVHARWSVWRAHRDLEPLWRDLVAAAPQVALDPAGCRVGDLEFRHYRRRVEICDALHALGIWQQVAAPDADDRWLNRIGRDYARRRRAGDAAGVDRVLLPAR